MDAWDRFSSDNSSGGGSGVNAVAHESGRRCLNEQREEGRQKVAKGCMRKRKGVSGERDIMGERVYAM